MNEIDVDRLEAAIARFYGRPLPYSTAEGIAREYEEGMPRIEAAAAEAERARIEPLRDAAQAVLTELDIIRRQWDTSKFAYPIVHIDTHEDLRAVLDAIDAPGTAPADPSPTESAHPEIGSASAEPEPDRADHPHPCAECDATIDYWTRHALATPDRADPLAGKDRSMAEHTDPSDCPNCGEWRDSPTADCAQCGFIPDDTESATPDRAAIDGEKG